MEIDKLKRIKAPENPKQSLFEIRTYEGFIQTIRVLAHNLRNGKDSYLKLITKDEYLYQQTRAAYFIYLNDNIRGSAHSDGRSVNKLHEQFKADFLLPLLCQHSEEFADLVIEAANSPQANIELKRALSVSDGSKYMNAQIFIEFFQMVQDYWETETLRMEARD